MERTKKSNVNNDFEDTKTFLLAELLAPGAQLVVNKLMLKLLGPEKAVFIANLIDKKQSASLMGYEIYHENGNEWIPLNTNEIANELCMSILSIRKLKQELESAKIIKVQRFGLPSKQYCLIDCKKIFEPVIPERLRQGGY